jgi:hypothetical protein
MSSSSADMGLAAIGSEAGIPSLNVASIPAEVRNGDSKARQAYAEGLAFENVLVNELSQQMASTMYGGQADSSAATDSTTGGDASGTGGGLLGAAGAYSSLIPQALSSSIMSGGGIGLAQEFAQDIDPALLAGSGQSESSTSDQGGAAV